MTDTLDGRATLDPEAFARFCETRSMASCVPGPGSSGSGETTLDAGNSIIMLEAAEQQVQNQRLLLDLHKAAQAGQVNGAFTTTSPYRDRRLQAVIFHNSDTWAGWTDCRNNPVDISPCAPHRVEVSGGGPYVEYFQQVDGATVKHRVRRANTLQECDCGGYNTYGDEICRNDRERAAARKPVASIAKFMRGRLNISMVPAEAEDYPAVDFTLFIPPRVAGQLEQALVAAAGAVSPDGQRELGRFVWNAGGAARPEHRGLFRRWLGTFEEATGERHVIYTPDLFGPYRQLWLGDLAGMFDKRPVCANPGSKQRGPCPMFLVSDTATVDTIRVAAHVDNASLAAAAQLAADGSSPGGAVALIAAITNPERK